MPKELWFKMMLGPCTHYWLEVAAKSGKIIAICKHHGCQKRGEFSMRAWQQLYAKGQAYAKPNQT
jgi:hypothetical protein